MARTAINLYSVRELDWPMSDILEAVAAAGYDGVQFSGTVGDAPPGEIADTVADLGLAVTPAHVGLDGLSDDPEAALAPYREVGADGAVVPWMEPEQFADRESAVASARLLEDLAASLSIPLHYHNHDHEFTVCGDETAFDAFAGACSVGLEVDVGWVETAGYDPAALIERYADRIDLVHMKDMRDGEFCELGDGDVDVQACADAARAVDASWLIYEHDEPADPAASIDRGAEVLDGL
ncbi:MAG: sugar phosphate isomerase/epimerase family protein [Haloarculaceae archaeon]